MIFITATTIGYTMGTTAMNIAPYKGDGLLLIAAISAVSLVVKWTANRIRRALCAGQRREPFDIRQGLKAMVAI
ncbi:MAG: hypothetical protein RBR63_11010 [Methanosarcina vacuolata]|nr:hypothetical protein [Methanosarcina vacuolata]